MITRKTQLIERDTFEHGFRLQYQWAWLITAAFFLGELGGGLFLVSLFLPGKLGFVAAVVGWLIVSVGKNFFHTLYLGRPLRFYRMVMRPNTSWISRGFFLTISLMLFGAIHIMFMVKGVTSPTSLTVKWIAGFCAFGVMIYDAIVMTYSPSLRLWNNALLPVMRTTYALMGGVTMVLFLSGLALYQDILTESQMLGLINLERGLIVANLIMIIIYILILTYSTSDAKESARLIIRDKYPLVFWLGVVLIGLVVIFMLPFVFTTHSIGLLVFAALCELFGDFCILFLIMRSGVYAPLMPHPNFDTSLFGKA